MGARASWVNGSRLLLIAVWSIEVCRSIIIGFLLEDCRFPDSARHVILCFPGCVFDANCPVWMGVAVASRCQGIYHTHVYGQGTFL